uniref:SHSP domain-containing protein n=1 Tax=Chromera velia CCMP2878 TaxID=1169474 RepID=A0A0G4I3Q8_9ALVE|eukprot:Cvel_10731.t1-p1 / transcript=Cvel_10731.t1 / gene=Cvel_10731 / organism=Chromera_velia_CCMP2878 / gene_product=hypothetical protein / transcript_product=hypothetical protein / location=Cvel_scaffold654:23655-25349(+) / protein_length=354 / sequence_SO=supercontig / SO=protein_coding / is_pseudo=false
MVSACGTLCLLTFVIPVVAVSPPRSNTAWILGPLGGPCAGPFERRLVQRLNYPRGGMVGPRCTGYPLSFPGVVGLPGPVVIRRPGTLPLRQPRLGRRAVWSPQPNQGARGEKFYVDQQAGELVYEVQVPGVELEDVRVELATRDRDGGPPMLLVAADRMNRPIIREDSEANSDDDVDPGPQVESADESPQQPDGEANDEKEKVAKTQIEVGEETVVDRMLEERRRAGPRVAEEEDEHEEAFTQPHPQAGRVGGSLLSQGQQRSPSRIMMRPWGGMDVRGYPPRSMVQLADWDRRFIRRHQPERFRRAVQLPPKGVDPEGIRASLRNGVLTVRIRLEKREKGSQLRRQITVREES